MCISWRHAVDGNPINVANAQSAKQLRIYLTPSQAIKHFSFIHGRRDSNTFYHPALYIYTHTYLHYLRPISYTPGHAIDVVLFPAALKIIRIFGTPVARVFPIGMRWLPFMWHAGNRWSCK